MQDLILFSAATRGLCDVLSNRCRGFSDFEFQRIRVEIFQ